MINDLNTFFGSKFGEQNQFSCKNMEKYCQPDTIKEKDDER